MSEMADHYIDNPHAEVSVGDRLEVKILSVDSNQGRISLSSSFEK
ncbi:MAG: S1 RNA-binding domain-containing protein [bacterium]